MNEEGDTPSVPEVDHSTATESLNEELASKTGNPQQKVADEKIAGPTLFHRFGSFIGRKMSTGQDRTESKEFLSVKVSKLTKELEESRRENDNAVVRNTSEAVTMKMEYELMLKCSEVENLKATHELELKLLRSEKTREVEDLEKKLADALRLNEEIAKREAEVEQFKKDLDSANTRIVQLEDEIQSQSQENDSLKGSHSLLEDEVKSATAEVEECRRLLESSAAESKHELDGMTRKADELTAEIDRYKRDLDAANSRLWEMEDKIKSTLEENNSLKASQLKNVIKMIMPALFEESGDEEEVDETSNRLEILRLVWNEIIGQVDTNIEVFKDKEIVRIIDKIAEESRHCKPFVCELLKSKDRFEKFLSIYQLYSREVNEAVKEHGEDILKNKSSVAYWMFYARLKIVFMCELAIPEDQVVEEWLFSSLIHTVISDYQRNEPAARCAYILNLAEYTLYYMIDIWPEMLPKAMPIFADLINCTIEMIRKDKEAFPFHREGLYSFLLELVDTSFSFLLTRSEETMQFTIDAVVLRSCKWGDVWHLNDLLEKVDAQQEQEAQSFYKKYYPHLLRRVFEFLLDPENEETAGYIEFTEVMCLLFRTIDSSIKVPLNEANPNQSNIEFISDHLCNILVKHFTMDEARVIVREFFSSKDDQEAMENHIEDFLAQLKKKRSD